MGGGNGLNLYPKFGEHVMPYMCRFYLTQGSAVIKLGMPPLSLHKHEKLY